MPNWLSELFTTKAWWGNLVYIAIYYLVAWIVHLLARVIARRLVRLSRLTPKGRELRPERRETLRAMLANVISFFAFAAATVASVGRFVTLDTLVWVVGLFSAAFGLSARPLISDVLAGIGLIFEDTFAPPMIATNGFSGFCSNGWKKRTSFSISIPAADGRWCATPSVDAWAR